MISLGSVFSSPVIGDLTQGISEDPFTFFDVTWDQKRDLDLAELPEQRSISRFLFSHLNCAIRFETHSLWSRYSDSFIWIDSGTGVPGG